jgi:hypothetical protein
MWTFSSSIFILFKKFKVCEIPNKNNNVILTKDIPTIIYSHHATTVIGYRDGIANMYLWTKSKRILDMGT